MASTPSAIMPAYAGIQESPASRLCEACLTSPSVTTGSPALAGDDTELLAQAARTRAHSVSLKTECAPADFAFPKKALPARGAALHRHLDDAVGAALVDQQVAVARPHACGG